MAINQNDIIYFVLTDRFYGIDNPDIEIKNKINKQNLQRYHGGNFDGLIAKIPYFKMLGITTLWITPVYLQIDLDTADGYHGYWALDFDSINPVLYIDNGKYPKGSKLYLKDLVDIFHKNDIKIVLDMVVNHTGYDHPAFTNSPYNPTPIRANWFNQVGLPCEQDEIQGQLAALPDLDLDNPDVCDYHIQTIISWIRETGIDGIRMDTVKHVERQFWNFFKTQIKGQFPDLSLLGEVLVFDIESLSAYQKYWAFDQLFDFPLQQAMKDVFCNGDSFKKFVSPFNQGQGILESDKSYTNHNKLVTLLDNHDLSARFITYALNQQFGDKAKATQILNLALTFMFTIRGIPQLYYGNEVGLEGNHDPDNRKDFPWNFFDENYNVKDEYSNQKLTFELTKQLIQIRKENKEFYCGNFVTLYVDDFLLVYLRYVEDCVSIVVLHNGWLPMPEYITIPVFQNPEIPNRIKDLLHNRMLTCLITGEEIEICEGIFRICMSPKSALILK